MTKHELRKQNANDRVGTVLSLHKRKQERPDSLEFTNCPSIFKTAHRTIFENSIPYRTDNSAPQGQQGSNSQERGGSTSKSKTKTLVSSVPLRLPTAQTSLVSLARIRHTTPPAPPLSRATRFLTNSPVNAPYIHTIRY